MNEANSHQEAMIVIGLMSGTSVDGIDAALVEVRGTETNLKVNLLAGATFPYPEDLRTRILDVCGGKALTIAELAELDDAIAKIKNVCKSKSLSRQLEQPSLEKSLW